MWMVCSAVVDCGMVHVDFPVSVHSRRLSPTPPRGRWAIRSVWHQSCFGGECVGVCVRFCTCMCVCACVHASIHRMDVFTCLF